MQHLQRSPDAQNRTDMTPPEHLRRPPLQYLPSIRQIVGFDVLKAGQFPKLKSFCAIDSSALVLQRRTLEQQQKALLSGKPDIQKQLASLKEQIIKQKTELERVQFLLEDDAATQKQFDDVNAQLNILQSQYDAALSSLSKNTASIVGNAAVITTQIDQWTTI